MDRSELEKLDGDELKTLASKYSMVIDDEKIIIESSITIPISTIWAVSEYDSYWRIVTDLYCFNFIKSEFKIIMLKYQ
jgi:hypothetical protein